MVKKPFLQRLKTKTSDAHANAVALERDHDIINRDVFRYNAMRSEGY